MSERLAFGSAITSWRHVEQLQEMGVTHVINLRCSTNKKVKQFRNIHLGFKADARPRPAWFHRKALKFYRRAVRKRHGKLFVMCHCGLSRSAAMVYFLLRCSGEERMKAEALITRARKSARVAIVYLESGEQFLAKHSELGR